MISALEEAIKQQDRQKIIDCTPYAKTIGMAFTGNANNDFILPASESNIGNPTLPALHGGCIGGFMENTAIVEVLFTLQTPDVPKVINFSLDYIRPGRFQDTFARCTIVRKGKKVVNVAISAWQTDIDTPIAKARAHLLL